MNSPKVSPAIVRAGLGPFDALDVIGQGAFGTTFCAQRGNDVHALKVIHRTVADYELRREAQSLLRIDHPNVVKLIQAGDFTVNGKTYPYLECEYIDGGTVETKLGGGALVSSPADLRGLLLGLLRGLSAIHQNGVIHRDIKPANVALRSGQWQEPVILDFGIAKVLDMSSHTLFGQAKGTVPFMSPEQLRGRPVRERSDLFSAALLVYLTGTGRHPFIAPGETIAANTLLDRMRKGAQPPRGYSPVWEDVVADTVHRLLSFHSAARLDLSRALSDLGD